MFCRNCGKEVDENAAVCPGCGVPPKQEKKFCPNCANPTEPNQAACLKCGVALSGGSGAGLGTGEKQKLVAGILAILLGALGIHKFYLGYTKEAVIMLVVSVVGGIFTLGLAASAMGIIGIIEGIIYLTKSDQDFDQTYVQNKKGWF